MINKLLPLALTALACVGACAPLSQAGLVYSSRAQVGVNVAGGTPETPGINLNIGMNVNDSAYIPVVVGRPCELGNNPACNQELMLVRGDNDVGSQTSDDSAGSGARSSPTPAPGTPGVKAMQDDPAPTTGDAPAEELDQESVREVVAEELTRTAKMSQSRNNRNDALSVYGTFDSNGTASAPGATPQGSAGLTLGRIFSTGVASQYLTEGQRDALRADALTRCLAAATAATAATDAVRNQLLTACAATVGR